MGSKATEVTAKDMRGSFYGVGFCSALSLLIIAEAPLLLLPFLLIGVLPWLGGNIRRLTQIRHCEQPGSVFSDAMGLVLNDAIVGAPAHDLDEKAIAKGVTKIAQITQIPISSPSESKWWITGKHAIDDSWVVVGPRGSGKSLTMRWMAREALRSGADVYWFDWHHNPQHEQHIDVLPGVPHEDYVKASKLQMLATLKHVLTTGQDRVDGTISGPFKPIVIFWDEFQDITSTALREPFDYTEQEVVSDAVRLIQDGFRKAKIQIVLSLKSVKKGQSGIDMSTMLQCNWLFTGKNGKNFSALEDKTAVFPDEISENRSRLASEAKGMLGKGTQGAICLLDGEAVVKSHPDCSALVQVLKDDAGFEVEASSDNPSTFFGPHMTAIEQAIASGQSKSAIFMSISGHGEKSPSNPKWVWFGQMFESVQKRLSEVAA